MYRSWSILPIPSAGQERFRTLTSSYYRGAHGAILMYDATNRESFDHLEFWLSEINQHANTPGIVKMLVGSKLDAPRDSITVPRVEGEIFAIEHSMLFYEISSKEGFGVNECFKELIEAVIDDPELLRRAESSNSPSSRRRIDSSTVISRCSSC